ncbi:MAG: M67 family metallopeptidase [Deltaproteobacteria bacterium]|nr:M67 family metallopeptidase [Deltaproteobacteria bacterium]
MPFISEYVLKQICLQTEKAYPSEACGILIGPKEHHNAIGLFPIKNIQDELHAQDPEKYSRTSKNAYYMDPKDVSIVEREAADKDFEFKVIYHSHPDHEVYFSEEDKLMAGPWGEPNNPNLHWVVVSVREGKAVAASLFSWEDEKKDYSEKKFRLRTL